MEGNIVIDLRPSQDFGLPAGEGFIQVDALHRTMALLRAPVGFSGDLSDNSPILSHRRHDAIFVNAPRGAGKTTFLARLVVEMEGEVAPDATKLLPLGLIDPTLIETKQNVVVVVIERIHRIVKAARDERRSARSEEYETFKTALRRLARGLAMLDGIGTEKAYGREWGDPEYVLSRGLEDAGAGVEFEREFHRFVELACNFLAVDKLVLLIDDIDTWFERGWPVLEAVRKYFTTPRLQIVLSGDMELYGHLLRGRQWAQMGAEFLQAERWQAERSGLENRMAAITGKVDELQEQYLVKVLRPERRIDLLPLTAFADRLRFKLATGIAVPARTIMVRLGRRMFGFAALAEQQDVFSLILRLPTRSAMQLLLAAHDLVQSRGATSPETSDRRLRALDGLRHIAWMDAVKLGLQPGEIQGLPPRLLVNHLAQWFTRRNLWRSMPRLHPETVDTSVGLPALFVAGSVMDAFERDPSQMISYWIKISIMREMVDSGQVSENGAGVTTHQMFEHLNLGNIEAATQTVSRLAAFELERGRRIEPGIYFSAVSIPLDRQPESQVAALELYGVGDGVEAEDARAQLRQAVRPAENSPTAVPPPIKAFHDVLQENGWSYARRAGTLDGDFANGLLGLADRIPPAAALLVRIPSLQIVSAQRKAHGAYSFLRVIGVIAALLETREKAPEKIRAHVRQVLFDAALVRTYPTPGLRREDEIEARGPRQLAEEGVEVEDDAFGDTALEEAPVDEARLEDNDGLLLALEEWIAQAQEHLSATPPLVLSRIWARFTYAHRGVRENLRGLESRYLGTFMFRSLVALLHATLIESLRAAGQRASPRANENPVRSPQSFVTLLHELDDDPDLLEWGDPSLGLFEALFTCPLWAYFLPRRTDWAWRGAPDAHERIFQAYVSRRAAWRLVPISHFMHVEYRPGPGARGQRATNGIRFDGLYELLNTVPIQGGRRGAITRPPPPPTPSRTVNSVRSRK